MDMSLDIGAKQAIKRLLSAALMALPAWATPATADPLPGGITAWFASAQTQALALEGGVLRVAFKKPLITPDLFAHQIKSLCQAPLVGQRYDWGNARIERIEIVNDIGQQGWALPGGRAACKKLNGMNSDEAAAYIERERREVRAGRVQE